MLVVPFPVRTTQPWLSTEATAGFSLAQTMGLVQSFTFSWNRLPTER